MTDDDSKSQNTTKEDHKHGKEKEKEKRVRKEKVKPLAKIIIRRLPPSMTEETFLKQIEPIPDYDYLYYVAPDYSLGQNAFCRAYINFSNQEDIFIFKDKFDGYIFIDTKGAEYSAVVEFAPFQSLPRNRARKKDNKCNTIETDQHYINFIESLNNEENDQGKGETKLEFSYQFHDDKRITSTPLLEYLANKKHERREEKKKKIDDRKKQREEERQRKKNFVSKNTIVEEESKDDDIMVRTIRSRPLGRNRNKKERLFESKPNNSQSNQTSTEERFKSNREERDKRRSERRKIEREKKQEIINRKEEIKEIKEEPKIIADVIKDVASVPKKEVKKYSEVRRERRARAEASSTNKSEEQIIHEKSEIISTTKEQEASSNSNENIQVISVSSSDTKKFSSSEKVKYNVEEKQKRELTRSQRRIRESDERAARRIRNKDRPSIEIYRPGKLRTQKSCDDGGKESPPSPSADKQILFDKDDNNIKLSQESQDDNEIFELHNEEDTINNDLKSLLKCNSPEIENEKTTTAVDSDNITE